MDSFLRSFFEKVYVEMAEKPQAWGRFHICFTVIGLAVVITAALLIRKKQSFKLYNGTLRAVGFFLMLCEMFKLAYNYYNLCGSDYNRWIYLFPFQLCSVPMYLAVIASFLRRGCRLRTALLTFMMTYTFMSGLAAFIEPSGILHADLFSTMHSCVWHMLLVFLGLLIGFYGEVGQELGHFGLAVITFVGCCACARAEPHSAAYHDGGRQHAEYVLYRSGPQFAGRVQGHIRPFRLGRAVRVLHVFADRRSVHNVPAVPACKTEESMTFHI